MRYSPSDWQRLGRAVYTARMKRAAYRDINNWCDAVGRTSRTLYGLERGEPVGPKTITSIEAALGWPEDFAYTVLSNPRAPLWPGGESDVFASDDPPSDERHASGS